MPTTNGKEQVFNFGIKNNDPRPADTVVDYLASVNNDGTQGKIDPLDLPISDAVRDALPTDYTNIVYVNSTSPNTATIFDTNNPPVTNNYALKADTDNLYIGSNASTWVYNGSTYVTEVVPLTSNFNIANTDTDAGNNKTAPISRTGTIEAPAFIKTGSTLDKILLGSGAQKTLADIKRGIVQNFQLYRLNLVNQNTEVSLNWITRRNIFNNSETYNAGNFFSFNNGVTVDQNDFIIHKGVKLTRFRNSNYYSSISLSQPIMTPGTRYMLSYYIKSNVGEDEVFDDISDSNLSGHNRRYIDSNVRRVFFIGQAITSTTVDKRLNPTVAIGSGSGTNWVLGVTKTNPVSATNPHGDYYLGGIQLEAISSSYVDGVIWIGDSTIQNNAGTINAYNNTAIPGFFADILNVTSFNKAVAGERLDQMDARWATDVNPLVPNSKYVIIQGGINDILQARTLSDMQTSVGSMNTKALANGLIPIFLTCSPVDTFTAPQEALRVSFNTWLKTAFNRVIDINIVLEYNARLVEGFPNIEYSGDGTHYGIALRKAVAGFIARSPFFEFLQPSDYQATSSIYAGRDLSLRNLSASQITLTVAPTTSAGSYDFISRHQTTGLFEKIPSSSVVRPYKSYTAKITQTGTSTPVATPLENQLGTVTWSYLSPGNYKATLTTPIDTSKFLCPQDSTISMKAFLGPAYTFHINILSSTEIGLITRTEDGTTLIDNMLSDKMIEFRVYN